MQFVGILVSVVLLGIVIVGVSGGQGLEALTNVWRRLGLFELIFAIVAIFGMQVVAAWRTQIVLAADDLPRPSLPALFRLQLVSQFMAHGAPVAGLADAAKVGMLALRFELPFGRSLRLIAYDRITGAVGVMVLGVTALLWQLFLSIPGSVIKLQAVVWAVGLFGLVLVVCAPMLEARSGIQVLDKMVDALTILASVLRRIPVILKLMAAAALQLVCMAMAFVILARAMQINIAPQLFFLFTPCIFFISSLPIFYLGWGAREAAVMLTVGVVSPVTSAEAAGLSVAFGATVFLASLPGAVFWAMRPSMRKSIRDEVKNAPQLSEHR